MRLFALLTLFSHDEIEQEECVPHGGVLPSQAVEITAARRPEEITLVADAKGQLLRIRQLAFRSLKAQLFRWARMGGCAAAPPVLQAHVPDAPQQQRGEASVKKTDDL